MKHLLKKFGLTVEGYEAMLAKQGGVCAVCKRPESTKHGSGTRRLSVDHCHATGKVRGLLCRACNTAAGLLRDDFAVIKSLLSYLESHR